MFSGLLSFRKLSPLLILETLVALVEHRGHVVRREQLIEIVWPDTVVEENNLSVNVSLLRKALGDRGDGQKYIETVSRRGYRFTATVRDVPIESAEPLYTRHARSLPLFEETSALETAPSHRAAHALSIGVLPFNQIGDRSGEDYLGIGLCDTLITRLSNVRRFVMRPTSSVVRYGEGNTEPLAAGRELKVDFVVDGRIRRASETPRQRAALESFRKRRFSGQGSSTRSCRTCFSLKIQLPNRWQLRSSRK